MKQYLRRSRLRSNSWRRRRCSCDLWAFMAATPAQAGPFPWKKRI
ncbi:MAG: hypothetical protein ACLR5H_10010 [Oscillospiraceae bacterium]